MTDADDPGKKSLTSAGEDKSDSRKGESDEQIFNETLKRMLQTPPKRHSTGKQASKDDAKRQPASVKQPPGR